MGGLLGYCVPEIGFIETATPANPAAGANLSWAVPWLSSQIVALVESLAFSFQTAGANRQVNVVMAAGASVFVDDPPGLVQPAGTTVYTAGVGLLPARLGNIQTIALPVCLLDSGNTVQTSILNIAAPDQVSAVVIRYRYWRRL